MIYDVNSSHFRSFLSQKEGGAYDKMDDRALRSNHMNPTTAAFWAAAAREARRQAMLEDDLDLNFQDRYVSETQTPYIPMGESSMSVETLESSNNVEIGSASQLGNQARISGSERKRLGKDSELLNVLKKYNEMIDGHLRRLSNWQIQKHEKESAARGDALKKIASLDYFSEKEQAALIHLVACDGNKVRTFLTRQG